MSRPTIGVVVATRDGRRFVEEQLRSIVEGSMMPDLMIVSDDESSDGTPELAEQILAPAGVAFDVVRNSPPLGVARNFAAAIARMTTDVAIFADQDDRWHPGRVAAVAASFADESVVMTHGDAELIDSAGAPLGERLFQRLEVSDADIQAISDGRAFETYLRRNLVTGATMAVRRSAVADALDVPAGWLHDEWFALIASTRGTVAIDEQLLVDYRLHGANQVGAAKPTLTAKIRRVVVRDQKRNERLADKFGALRDFLVRAGFPESAVELAEAKYAFEVARAGLPRARLLRIPGVGRAARAGGYSRYASRGKWDVIRDLLQPR